MSRYTVTAERSGKWWVLQAVEAPGAISQVARLDQADQIKEAIAFVTGEPEEHVEIDVVPALPDEARVLLDHARELRDQARQVEVLAQFEQRRAAHSFVASGFSLRDTGWVMGLSHQRVHQLTTSSIASGEMDEAVLEAQKGREAAST